DVEDETPRSSRQRRSGLSRLAEKRGLIASPTASNASLRSVGGTSGCGGDEALKSPGTNPGAVCRLQRRRLVAAGCSVVAKSSSSAVEDEGGTTGGVVRLGSSMKRSISSQDLASTSESQADMLMSTAVTSAAADDNSLGLDRLNDWDNSGSSRLGRLQQRRFQSSTSLANVPTDTRGSMSSLASNASSTMRKIPVSDVRNRTFLHGSLSANGLLGADQLDALIADRRVDIMAVTWNMAGLDSKSYPRSLESLLFPPDQEHVPDVYALCFQEVTPDIKELLLRCQATIGPNHVLFEFCRNKALLLAIFLRRDLIWFVSVPDTSFLSTRVAMATKGCAAICFTLFGTSMLFISSHFKRKILYFCLFVYLLIVRIRTRHLLIYAHMYLVHLYSTDDDANFEKRIHDYQKIITRLDLPKFTKPVRKSNDVTERFDYVIWSGDLNFRVRTGYGDRQRVDRVLTASTSPAEVPPDVADALTAGDELKMAQAEGKIFQNFLEGDIRFPPTYKFDINSDVYDTSNKQRVPSYTDRVLYRCRRPGTATVTAYNSIRELRCSDHRPVYAVINATIRPGVDSIPLAHGRFRHDIYVEGTRRRATQLDLSGLDARDKASQVCSVM
uniref:IPPc domain-containing protein n=1 Tax=Macrostomum lignano TaxID=282301 RepID=A0A1I8HBX1_9PLAT